MLPTEILKEEHQLILKVLDAAEREVASIAASGRADAAKVEQILDFIRTFADHCHHAKEEDLLFVKMTEKGFPRDAGPIRIMLMEHEQGRAHVAAVSANLAGAAAGDGAALAAVGENLLGYARLLRQHIHKEDTILYPMADRLFTETDQADLAAAFQRVERDEIGEGVHEKYHELAHTLAGE